MKWIQPSIEISGDREDRIMARSGYPVGHSRSRVVWRFGFLQESDAHKAYGVYVNSFFWVITNKTGKVLATHSGFTYDLPIRFQRIIGRKL